ncbi:hypothetical protein [Desulfolithobacter sp.]
MHTQPVIIFPDTIPSRDMLLPLVQVFAPVVYCQPVERKKNDCPEEGEDPLVRTLIDQDLCQLFAPAPLGQNRERFLHLVRDLQTRRDDYAGQLGHLTLAGIGSSGRPDQETRTSIIGSLLAGKGIESREEQEQEMILWQARLILKLAELLDDEQRQLQAELDRISNREHQLFQELRSENGEPFSLTGALLSASGTTDGQLRLRLKAWARLFGLGRSWPGSSRILVTRSRDALDLLIEEYPKVVEDGRPTQLFSIELPANLAQHQDLPGLRQRLQEEGSELLEKLHEAMETVENGGFQEAEEDSWQKLLEAVYPARSCGRCRLTMIDFPKTSADQFFLQTFGSDDALTPSPPAADQEQPGTVVGVLERIDH